MIYQRSTREQVNAECNANAGSAGSRTRCSAVRVVCAAPGWGSQRRVDADDCRTVAIYTARS
jgi:hypothetical protein